MQHNRLSYTTTFLTLMLFCIVFGSKAQIGINTINPDTSAAIDIQGINKGVLFPRITQAQLPNIFQPATGLTVFQSDNTPGLYFNIGTALSPNWRSVGMMHRDSNLFWKGGFIGIGTELPAVELHVKSASNGRLLRLESGVGKHAYIEFYADGPTTRSGYFGYPGDGVTNLSIVNGRANGDIVINTTGTGTVNSNTDINTSEKIQEDGNDLIPAGVIVMWSGSPTAIPAGWALCDGSGSTPDLRGRFVVGYNSSNTDYNNIGDVGGFESIGLSVAQIPSHTHGSGTLGTNSAGTHNHGITWGRGSTNGSSYNRFTPSTSAGGSTSNTTGNAGSHSHTISGNTGSAGSGQDHENRPPYYTLAYIIKL